MGPSEPFEPMTLLGALSAVTTHIGLVATASTTFNFPYNVARQFASLEQLSRGRSGWNVVTSYDAERAFGLRELPSPAERYRRAQEFLDVVIELWHSWEPDAIIADRERQRYIDVKKIHPVDFHGDHIDVEGALDFPASPQGHPVIFQAGSSSDGLEFASRNAEGIFCALPTMARGVEFYQQIKSRAVDVGREPDSVKVLPGLRAFIGDTREEAEANFVRTAESRFDVTVRQLEADFGLRVFGYPLDRPRTADLFPTDGEIESMGRRRSRLLSYKRLALDPEYAPTFADFVRKVAVQADHTVLVGTAQEVADELERWFVSGAADGFTVNDRGEVSKFLTRVIPILVNKGLFRREYEGTTFRDHLGLRAPQGA